MMLVETLVFGMIFLLTKGVRSEVTEVVGEAGSQVVLPCICEAAQCDPAAITWSKDNKGTVWRKQSSGLQYWGSNWFNRENSRVQCPHLKFAKGDYSLEINGLKEDDAGLYTCKVEIKGHSTDKRIMLRIIEASVFPSTPMWGDDVSVRCSVTPWPENAVVYWTLNNQPYAPKTRTLSGRAVDVQASDKLAGTWTCSVHRSSNVWSASVELSVTGIIQPPKQDTKLYAALGSSFTMPCVFSPSLSPKAVLVEKLDSGFQIFNNRSASSSSWDKSIVIQEVVPENEGRYRCGGTIQERRLSQTMQLVVAKIVKSKKKGTTMLSCQLSDPSEVTDYQWVHVSYDINGTESVGPVQYGQTVPVKEDLGEWTCRYLGTNGLLGNVTTQVHVMAGLSGEISSGVSSNTGTVVGLSFLLIILLLVLAQMYKNHRRRRRILQYPALETIVHTISNEREEREKDRVKK
ncbi:lymphocyte activation gene 3 protein-like [Xiphophorus maculatus]|uniref:lymphocyte activation gene 3 protein-like n=1 Tax=Xiphophorus maculatus TaxID=8083 RepID=UPI000293BC46|nr:lymphocyte activation gene 3 protein-like [Xiphophorus maculatus]